MTEALSWTVLSWNIRGSGKPDLDRLASIISVESPDVVVLQEVRKNQAERLAQLLAMRYTWALKHYPFTPLLARCAEGAAILSPHALDAAAHTEIGARSSSWTWRRRIAQWALVGRADTSAYRVYNLHLSPGDRRTDRRAEVDHVTDLVAGHGEAPPAVIAGDFNDGADPSVVAALPGLEPVPPSHTNPAEAPTQTLDHVLVPPDANDVAVTVPAGGPEWAELSDHLPVTVRFRLDWVRGDFDTRPTPGMSTPG